MKHLVLVHPGFTEYDQQGRIQGTLDVPLSQDGRRQVEAAAEQLRPLNPIGLYTAPGQASRQTSDILAASLGLKPRTLDKLVNVDHGLWQGMLVDDVKTKQPKVFRKWLEQPESVCPPEGESIRHAKLRVSEVMNKLLKKMKPDSTLLLVAPEPIASVVRHVVSGAELGDLWHSTREAGRWEQIDIEDVELTAARGGA